LISGDFVEITHEMLSLAFATYVTVLNITLAPVLLSEVGANLFCETPCLIVSYGVKGPGVAPPL
jgi:hypothetical protein